MDSAAIATELEARYPTPSLRLNPKLEKEAEDASWEVFHAVGHYFLPATPKIVAPEDIQWFKEDRARRFGMTIEDAFETEKDRAPFYEAAKPGFESCAKVLRDHKKDDGPFILGSEPSYADFYLVAFTQMFERAGGKWLEEYLNEAPPEVRELHEACQQWAKKQD